RSGAELKRQREGWRRTAREAASPPRRSGRAPSALMFSGRGSQHAGMAAQLYQTRSVFRKAMDRCHALAQPYLEHGLLDVIFAEGSDDELVYRPDYTMPELFAVE